MKEILNTLRIVSLVTLFILMVSLIIVGKTGEIGILFIVLATANTIIFLNLCVGLVWGKREMSKREKLLKLLGTDGMVPFMHIAISLMAIYHGIVAALYTLVLLALIFSLLRITVRS